MPCIQKDLVGSLLLGGGDNRTGKFDFLQVALLEIKTCKTTYCVLDDGCTLVAFEGVICVHTHFSYRCYIKDKDEVTLSVVHFFIICSC